MFLRTTLAAAALMSLSVSAQAEHPLCCKLFGHHQQPCCGSDCQVHVHYCTPPAEDYAPPAQRQAMAPQMLYAPILPSAVGFTMPMMPMMQMGMMQPYAQQQFTAAPQAAPQPASAPRTCADATTCGDCEPRVARLEEGVKNLSSRMDRIGLVLENQTRALEGIKAKLGVGPSN
jgi:hypothetical protein